MPTGNQAKFNPPRWNPVYFDHPHQSKAKVDAHTKTKRFPPRTPKPSQLLPPALKPSHLIPTKKQVMIAPHTIVKSTSIHTWKPNKWLSTRTQQNQFPSRHKKQVDFDLYVKTESITIPRTKSNLILTPSLNSSQFWSPLYYHLDFDAPTETPR